MPVAVRSVVVVRVGQHDLDPRPAQRQPQRRADEPGTRRSRPGPSEISHRGVAWHPGQVGAQRRGAVQVDVGDVGAGQVGLDVGQHPHHPGHGPLDLELAGAQQRHLAEAELAGGVRRELRDQVRGGGEDHRDEVVDLEPVGGHRAERPSPRPGRACARARPRRAGSPRVLPWLPRAKATAAGSSRRTSGCPPDRPRCLRGRRSPARPSRARPSRRRRRRPRRRRRGRR